MARSNSASKNLPLFCKVSEKGTLLLLYIQPNAPMSSIIGEHDGRLKIKIKAPPIDGEANEELIRFLSEILKVSKSKIHLLQGVSSRQKNILVELTFDHVRTILLQLLNR